MTVSGLNVCALASGSKGNAVFVSGGDSAVLVDAGLSGIELERRMAARGLSPEMLSAVVITHEHTDHIKGAGILSRRFDIPLYLNKKTMQAASSKLGTVHGARNFKCGVPFCIGDLKIDPFSISHDAADPSGFTLEHGGVKMGIATDLGVATHLVKTHLKGCSLLYIEANHDPDMLNNGPYPWYLKQRVKSRLGHLSNADAGELVNDICDNGLSHVILAHLSHENNTPECALQTFQERLNTPSVQVDVAMPHIPGTLVSL
ncbi:Phosphoribosyl 1,2-cyclic phosphodiesterase [Desulfocicer vacuolatum DSM 3385]|uniref:Phosphoribosyl 1,2-cyclic phosphodiesterase n=1 Tax=Desulfocicer vacuolatum DSM 3385 TaxID=1121400 RepID=A0A1W1ZUW0_9BACT|nr:MBL fold metallo-hydrolase [Desulfocicer vacuolatum]SMC52220.1 Phosphoribosyl 1,2-cyclic phosphodiesterase [Desulfocicer vacuolatum DSM 3385]